MPFDQPSSRRFINKLVALLAVTGSLATFGPSVQAQTGTVIGRVLGPSGQAMPFSAVQWEGAEGWTAVRADGGYALTVPAGARSILAQALGYRTGSQSVEVPAGGSVTVDFRLETRPLDVAGINVSVLSPGLTPASTLEDRKVREANPKDAGQLLREIDGVAAVRRGPLGLDPVVRGLRETEVGTYLDGTVLFPAGPARMDSPLTHLDPAAVRSIEVVKGPYALTWGAGNMSAIRVETQRLPEVDSRPKGSVAMGYDQNLDAWETSVAAHGRSGPVSYTVDGAWRDGGDYEAGGGWGTVPGDFESWDGRGKIGLDVGEAGQLIVAAGYQDQGPIDYPGNLLTAETFKAPNFSGRFTWTGEGTLAGFEATAYRNRVEHTMSNRDKPTAQDMATRMPPCALDIGVESELTVLGGRLAADLDLGGPWSAEVGGDVYRANPDATRTIARASGATLSCNTPLDNAGAAIVTRMWPDAKITDAGTFARGSWRQGAVAVSGTVRVDRVSADAPPGEVSSYFTDNNPSGADLDATETNLSGAVTASFDVDENWVLAVGVGSVVRTADASERYSDRIPATKAQFAAEFMGDPQLDPERSTQGDVWVDGRFEDLQLRLGAFYRKIGDYITIQERTDLANQLPLSVPPRVYQYVNGDASFYGFDGSATVGVTDEITVSAVGSYLWGADDALDEPAIGIAPFKGSLGLRYEEPMGRFYMEAVGTGVDRQGRVAASRNEGVTPGYGTFDLRAGLGLPRGVTLRTGVLNVFDKYYYDHLNARNPFALPDRLPVPEPGRTIFFDVTVAF